MYTEHFGLSDLPFRLTPDVDYMFMSSGHARAKSYIDFAIASKDGFVVITGDIGSGKTTLMRSLLAEMHESTILVHIDQTQVTPAEFLQLVVQDLVGEAVTGNKVELLRLLRKCLEEAEAQDLRVVLCVDEAQALSFEVLEEVRLISALEARKEAMMSVVLMGQPELREKLEAPELEQLRQRVRLHYHLSGLKPTETRNYVLRRLSIAGAAQPDQLFTDDAWNVLYRYTGGVPRLINLLCDMAMLRAYVNGQSVVDGEVMISAAKERRFPLYSERQAKMKGRETPLTLRRPNAEGKQGAASGDDAGLTDVLARMDDSLRSIEQVLQRIADSLDSPATSSVDKKRGIS